MGQDIDSALCRGAAQRLKYPVIVVGLEVPFHRVPYDAWAAVPNREVIGMDLKIGGGDDPVRGVGDGVHGVDF